MMGFVFAVAGRYLFSSRGERLFGFVTVFSIVGIAIGVAAINTVQAAQNGIIAQTLEEARRGVPDLIVRGTRSAEPSILEKIRALPEVTRAGAFVEGQAVVTFEGRAEPIWLQGLEPEALQDLFVSSDTEQSGTLSGFSASMSFPDWPVVLPSNLIGRLGVFRGETVELLSADGQSTALGWTPRAKDFVVIGFHDVGGSLPVAYIPLGQGQIYLRQKDQWNGLRIYLEPQITPQQIKQLRQKILELLETAHLKDEANTNSKVKPDLTSHGGQNALVRLETWEDMNVVQADILRVMKRVMTIVLALIMGIAGFNILASQLMLVREKRMSIAVFRTMGTTRCQLIVVFVLIGQAIGIGGVAIGLALTFLFGWLATVFGVSIPLQYAAADLTAIAGIAVLVCFIATVYPAIRAARVDPATALREA